MEALLLLVHRIPYPPNKGDKIRSYHLTQYLSQRYRLFLGSFVDDPHDWRYKDDVAGLCSEACFRPLSPLLAKVRSLTGLVTGKALSLPYFYDRRLQRWVDEVVAREKISRIMVYSSSMAQYAERHDGTSCRRIVDFVDVDSDKWRQYAERSNPVMAGIYRREARTLLEYERSIASRFDKSLFVSAAEADLFRRLAPDVADKIDFYGNGVDTAYFDPALDHQSPYPGSGPVIVFTGAMDYWANVEAVSWFAKQVFPRLRDERRDLRFFIVGSNPTDEVRALGDLEGIEVTGRVDDIRPYLSHAALAVAPLRIARGIQNKVLEALAMAKTVICTPAAAEGLQREPWLDAWVCEAPRDFANAVLKGLEQGPNWQGRDYVVRHYSWEQHLSRVEAYLE